MSHGELYDVNDYSPILAENIYYQYEPILSTYYIFYPEAVTLSRILFPFSSGQTLGGLIVRNRCNQGPVQSVKLQTEKEAMCEFISDENLQKATPTQRRIMYGLR